MIHSPTPPEEEHPFFSAQNAPWMPLDELAAVWAAFGCQASTATAARATSEAFAAIAEERAALHTYTTIPTMQRSWTSRRTQVVALHQCSIESLMQAATHWFAAACALQESIEQPVQENGVTHEHVQFLVGHTLAQRLRVWTIAQHLLAEQVANYPPTQHTVGAASVTDCSEKQQQEIAR